MSQPGLANPQAAPQQRAAPPTTQKQRLNVYTMMLILATIFMIVAIVMLWLELGKYDTWPYWNTQEAKPSVSYIQSAPSWPHAVDAEFVRSSDATDFSRWT